MSIRIDCYLARLNEFRKKFPDAHFEVITNVAKSALAPSKELLIEAGIFKKKNGTKNPKMDFETYKIKFIQELDHNAAATLAIVRLLDIYDQGRTIFLVCYEKDPKECHRSIIKEVLEAMIKKREEKETKFELKKNPRMKNNNDTKKSKKD